MLDPSTPIDAVEDQDSRVQWHSECSQPKGQPFLPRLVEMHLAVDEAGDRRKNIRLRVAGQITGDVLRASAVGRAVEWRFFSTAPMRLAGSGGK